MLSLIHILLSIVQPTTQEATKTWVGGETVNPSATFTLLADGQPAKHLGTYTDTHEFVEGDLVAPITLNHGETTVLFENLPLTTHDGTVINYTIEESEVPGFEMIRVDNYFVNRYLVEPTEVIGTKTWFNGETLKPEATFTLLADGQPAKHLGSYNDSHEYFEGELVAPFVLAYGETEIKFENLPTTTLEGVEIVYTIEEADVEGFEKIQTGNDFVNIYVMTPTIVNGTKTWVGGSALKPTTSFVLLADGLPAKTMGYYTEAHQYIEGQEVKPITLAYGESSIVFSDVPLNHLDGSPIEYEIVEAELEGFKSVRDGFDFTNTYIVEMTEIEVKKVWVDAPEKKPEITIVLYGDGQEVERLVLKEGEETVLFTDIPLTTLEGVPIKYTVDELEVKGYTKSINGFVITNTYIKPTKLPNTGDSLLRVVPIGLTLISLGIVLLKKKEQD